MWDLADRAVIRALSVSRACVAIAAQRATPDRSGRLVRPVRRVHPALRGRMELLVHWVRSVPKDPPDRRGRLVQLA